MNYVYKIEHWAESHQVKSMAFLRIILGLVIFLKGLFFITKFRIIFGLYKKNLIEVRNKSKNLYY